MATRETPVGTTREDLRRKRELEEARKSGLIPAEKDEEGRDINPHIPQYIARAPWYLNNEQPSLKHQRRNERGGPGGEDESRIAQWYSRGIIKTPADATAAPTKKFKPGSCRNCGATTHQAVDCLERPRAKGAKWTGKDIAPDEYIPNEEIKEFEAKRDRWGGYDPDTFKFVVDEYKLVEEEQKKRANASGGQNDKSVADSSSTTAPSAKKRKKRTEGEQHSSADDSSSSDESTEGGADAKIKDFDVSNAPVGTKDDRTRTTTRNLRIREDKAKYLINLDLESAFYDPKTRSMRGDPTKGLSEDVRERTMYRGDNAIRNTGETGLVRDYDTFAWDAYKHGQEIHRQAHPTQLELTYSEHKKKKETLAGELRNELLTKYGGAEHLQVPKDLRGDQEDD